MKNEKTSSSKKTSTTSKSTNAKASTTATSKVLSTINNSNHLIEKDLGSKMITDLNAIISKSSLPFTIANCFDFNRAIFDMILSDPSCDGIRFYFGLNDVNELCLVFTGIKGNDDIYLTLSDGKPAVADMGQVCVPAAYGRSAIMLP